MFAAWEPKTCHLCCFQHYIYILNILWLDQSSQLLITFENRKSENLWVDWKPLEKVFIWCYDEMHFEFTKKLHIHSYSYEALSSTLNLQLFMSNSLGKDVSHSVYDSKG